MFEDEAYELLLNHINTLQCCDYGNIDRIKISKIESCPIYKVYIRYTNNEELKYLVVYNFNMERNKEMAVET